MAKKMSKDIRFVVEKANNVLALPLCDGVNGSERDGVFSLINSVLMDKNMYHGFNYYEKRKIGASDVLVLAGKETTLIQFEIM